MAASTKVLPASSAQSHLGTRGHASAKGNDDSSSPSRTLLRALTDQRSRGFALALSCVALAALVAAVIHAVRDRAGLDLRIYRDAVVSTFRDGLPLYGTVHEAEGLPFTYPPFAAVFLAPLALVPVGVGVAAMFMACVVLAVTVYALVDSHVPMSVAVRTQVGALIAAALITDPFRLILGLGQVDSVLALLVLADVFLFPPAFRGAGVGIAIAVKLTPVVFLGYFVWCKQWRSVALAAAAAICCSGLAELVIPRSNADYWHWLSTNAESIGRFDFVSNQSFRGLAARIWGSSPQAVLAWVLCCVVVAVVATVALSRLARADFLDRLQAFTVIAIAGLLVAPIAWSHHWTIIIVVGAFAVVSPDSRTRIASWALWLVAFGGVFWFAGGSPVGFLRGWPADVLVSNALVLAGFAWLCACALGVKHRHCAPRLPRGDGQYQAAEQHSEHHRTGPAR